MTSPAAIDWWTRQGASGGYSGLPTKLSAVAYRRSTTASGITVRMSIRPASVAGDADAAPGVAPTSDAHTATTDSTRAIATSASWP